MYAFHSQINIKCLKSFTCLKEIYMYMFRDYDLCKFLLSNMHKIMYVIIISGFNKDENNTDN